MRDRLIEDLRKEVLEKADSPIYHSKLVYHILKLYQDNPELLERRMKGIDFSQPVNFTTNPVSEGDKDNSVLEGDKDNPKGDNRITKMMMHGIRGVGNGDNDSFYGFDCSDSNGNPCSMIIIGANGVGKTSFYSALETISMGKSNCASLRGYESPTILKDFMSNIHTDPSKGVISIKTGEGKKVSVTLDKVGNLHEIGFNVPESCFCSDFDIQVLETYSYTGDTRSFSAFIHSQLGLKGYGFVIKALEDYNKQLERRTQTAEQDSRRVSALKEELFLLNVEKWLLDDRTSQSEISKIVKGIFDRGEATFVDTIERYVSEDRIGLISNDTLHRVYNQYEAELKLMSKLTGVSEVGREVDVEEVIRRVGNPEFLYQSNDDIEYYHIPNLYPKVMYMISHILNNDVDIDALTQNKELVLELSDYRKKLRAITANCRSINGRVAHQTYQRQIELGMLISEKERMLDTVSRSMLTGIPIDIRIVPKLLEEAKALQAYLEKKLCGYDERIFPLLKRIVPDLCERSLSSRHGENVVVHYGTLGNLTEPEPQVNFDKPKEFELFIKVRKPGEERYEKTEPRLYLNTFRHKLFCFALKLGLACCSMQLDNCKYPIVVDDVFDASDFVNRNDINNVIKSLLKGYKEFSGGVDDLQIILFTQDEIIAERVYKGLNESNNKVRLERLISRQEYDKAETTLLNNELSPVETWIHIVAGPGIGVTYAGMPDIAQEELVTFRNVAYQIKRNC